MYKIIEFIPKQKMVLEINESYWGSKPSIPKVINEEIADTESRVMAALSGRYHVAMNIPATGVSQFAGSDAADIFAQPPASSETIYLNLSKPQLQDVRVRQALSWALDRDELVILGAEGQSTSITTWIASNPAFPDAKSIYYSKYDPQKAAELLDEAGWILGSGDIRYKNGEPLSVRLMTWGVDQALGEAIQSQWTRIGVKAEVSFGDYTLIETARSSGDWDAFIEAWTTFGDLGAMLKGQYSPTGGGNYGGYDDELTNLLLEQLANASNEEERHDLTLRISDRVAEQSPAIYVYPRPELTAVSRTLNGFVPHFRQFENVVNANLTISD
jgi:peptide/nickel transport system substrate-binding protein